MRSVRCQHVEGVMGTAFTVDAVFSDRSEDDGLQDVVSACRQLHAIDRVFSTWRSDSPVSRYRRGELAETDLPQQVTEVLDSCARAREASGGWFDPWAAPDGVDPTGYVKGWAGQLVLDALRDSGADAALVNAAGDVAGFGGPEAGRPWLLGLTDPFDPTRLLGTVAVENCSLAVSGTYERGDHVYGRHGGPAASGVVSAAVLGPDLGQSDALATALVAGGQEALDHVAKVPGHQALVIFQDGRWSRTEAFPLRAMPARVGAQAS
jgi:thiamine biosynthesis lipoprotein